MAEREKELKRLLMRVKEEERKTGLKLNMQKIKLMASTPIISWQKDGGKGNSEILYLFSWAPKPLWMVIETMKLKDAFSLEEKL